MCSEIRPGFDCSCCGDCCSGDMDIFVNIYDLYKITKYLGYKNSKELFESRLFKFIPGQNGLSLPKINFKTKPYKFCPFLTNSVDDDLNLKGFCTLHPLNKPLVCILAPISREIDIESSSNKFYITYPSNHCNGKIYREDEYVKIASEKMEMELIYESRYYKILDNILSNGIINYESIYYFSIKKSIEEILSNIESFSCKNVKTIE